MTDEDREHEESCALAKKLLEVIVAEKRSNFVSVDAMARLVASWHIGILDTDEVKDALHLFREEVDFYVEESGSLGLMQ